MQLPLSLVAPIIIARICTKSLLTLVALIDMDIVVDTVGFFVAVELSVVVVAVEVFISSAACFCSVVGGSRLIVLVVLLFVFFEFDVCCHNNRLPMTIKATPATGSQIVSACFFAFLFIFMTFGTCLLLCIKLNISGSVLQHCPRCCRKYLSRLAGSGYGVK